VLGIDLQRDGLQAFKIWELRNEFENPEAYSGQKTKLVQVEIQERLPPSGLASSLNPGND
jgi:hypothetical protein